MEFDFLNKGVEYIISSISKFGYKILICVLIGFFGIKLARFISKKINEIKNREKFDKYKNYIIIFIICLVIFYFFLWRK